MSSSPLLARFPVALLLLGPAFAAGPPTASELAAFERFATRPTARIAWSTEVARIESAPVHAIVTALSVEDPTQSPGRMRGVRIDLSGPGAGRRDEVFIAEDFLERLAGALDEIQRGSSYLLRTPSGGSRCFGSGAFLNAMREGAHFFHASQCAMADGWFGLQVSTGAATFRFTDLDPSPFAEALDRATLELKRR